MTSALPDVVVEMSSDGAAWVDISDHVSLRAGLTARRGRSNEFDTCAPGTLRFTVTNTDPTFWGIGGWFDSLYGLVKQNTHVRVTVDSTQVWQGRVDSYRWHPGKGGSASTVDIEATDECKILARARLYPFAVETQKTELAWTGGGVFPMQPKAVGSYLSAHRDPTLTRMTVVNGSAGGRTYSQDGPPFVKQSMKIIPRGQVGPVMEHPTTWSPASTFGLVSVWFRTENTTDTMYLFSMLRTSGGSGYAAVWLDGTTGRLTFSIAGDSGGSIAITPSGGGYDDLNDGDWHLLTFWLYPDSGTTKLRYYVDGSAAASTTSGGSTVAIGSSNRRAVFGGQRNSAWTTNNYAWDGDIATPAIFTYSTISDDVTDWYDDGMYGRDPGQTVANRLTDLAAFVGATAPTTADLVGYTITGQDLDGRSLLDAYQELAASELGVFYIDRLGVAQLRGWDAYTATGSVVTGGLSAVQDLSEGLELALDDATYANYVRATSPSGVVVDYDSALVASDGAPLIDEWSSLIYDDTNLATHAGRRLTQRSTPTPRLSRVTVDLLTCQNTLPSEVLMLEPLDRVYVDDLDADLFGATSYAGFVEGWELTISTSEYRCSLDLSPDVF